MSLYEILVLVALAATGGSAYWLYRSDTQAKTPPPDGKLMFGRDKPKD
jgi:hypothetical protein